MTTHEPTWTQGWRGRARIRDIVLVLLLPLLSAGVGLMVQSPWLDELVTLRVAQIGLWKGILKHITLYALPLQPSLAWVFTLGGRSLFGGRLLSLLAFMGAAWLVQRIAGRLLGEKRAVWATAAFALNPLMVWYAQDARMYTLWVFVCLGAVWFLLRALEGEDRKDLLGFGAFALAAFLTHLYSVLMASALALSTVIHGRTLRRKALVIGVLVLTGSLALPAIIALFVMGNTVGLGPRAVSAAAVGYALLTFGIGFGFGPTSQELHAGRPMDVMLPYLPAAVLFMVLFWGAVGYGTWRLARSERHVLAALLPFAVLPLVLSLVMALVFNKQVTFNVRYALPSLPFILILFAGAGGSGRTGWAAALALFAVQGVGSFLHYTDTRHWKEDYRGVAELVRAVTLPGDTVYYTLYPGLLHVLLDDRKVKRLAPDVLDAAANPSGCGVFIINSPWLSDASGTLRRKLEQLPGVQTHQLRGFAVYVAPVRKAVLPEGEAPTGRDPAVWLSDPGLAQDVAE